MNFDWASVNVDQMVTDREILGTQVLSGHVCFGIATGDGQLSVAQTHVHTVGNVSLHYTLCSSADD